MRTCLEATRFGKRFKIAVFCGCVGVCFHAVRVCCVCVVGCVCAVHANQKRQTKATPINPQSNDSKMMRPSVRAGAGVCVRVRFMGGCAESIAKDVVRV